jgi:heptosyltransferase II
MKNSPINILVIQTAFIGDVIMGTPIFKGLKKIYPQASIDVLVVRQNKAILANNPNIRTIYTIEKKNKFRKVLDIFKLVTTFRKNHYDMAISLQIHFTNSFLMVMSKIKKRVGAKRQKLLTDSLVFPKGIHQRERIGNILHYLENQQYDLTTELFPTNDDYQVAAHFFRESDHFKIGIAPGSVRKTKKWSLDYHRKLVAMLPDNIDIYLIGGKDDIADCQQMIPQNCSKNVIQTAGKCSILQSAALIDKLDLMIANDSAPLHLANAMNTPVFAFFGPTVKRFGCYPYREKDKMFEVDLPCRPCGKHGGDLCPLGHHDCMQLILPEQVKESIMELLYEKNHSSHR